MQMETDCTLERRLSDQSSDPGDGLAHEQIRTASGKVCRNLAAVRSLRHDVIAAIVADFDSSSFETELGIHEKAVRESVSNNDGLFVLGRMMFNGSPGKENGHYRLTEDWSVYLDENPNVLANMRTVADRWNAAQSHPLTWTEL